MVHWADTAILAKGTEIRAVKFLDNVTVDVITPPVPPPAAAAPNVPLPPQVQQAARPDTLTIRFPSSPVRMLVNGQEFSAVVDENTTAPGGPLNIPRELTIPTTLLQGNAIQEGLHTLIRHASGRWYLLLAAWALLGIPFIVTAVRWRGLMRPQGINMPLAKCLQLTFVGQFYSIMLPGITGGDLVKIVYAARLTGSKTKSFITIILDRVIGLIALMVIAGTSAGIQLFLNARHAAGAPAPVDNTLLNVFIMIVALLAILATGATIYFSHRLRRLVGIEWFVEHFGAADPGDLRHQKLEHLFRVLNTLLLIAAGALLALLAILRWAILLPWALHNNGVILFAIAALALLMAIAGAGLLFHELLVARMTPLIGKLVEALVHVDETLHVYRGHFGLLAWAIAISLFSQLTLPLSAWLSGTAFGMTAPVTHYLAYIPVAVLAASLPISPPQGIGIMDWIIVHFFAERGAARVSQAFALTQAVRFLPMLWNLTGAYFVITGNYSRHHAQEEMEAGMPSPAGASSPAPAPGLPLPTE
jgi:uncharacterized membrane protein YbhN (UPF0104 family)